MATYARSSAESACFTNLLQDPKVHRWVNDDQADFARVAGLTEGAPHGPSVAGPSVCVCSGFNTIKKATYAVASEHQNIDGGKGGSFTIMATKDVFKSDCFVRWLQPLCCFTHMVSGTLMVKRA